MISCVMLQKYSDGMGIPAKARACFSIPNISVEFFCQRAGAETVCPFRAIILGFCLYQPGGVTGGLFKRDIYL